MVGPRALGRPFIIGPPLRFNKITKNFPLYVWNNIDLFSNKKLREAYVILKKGRGFCYVKIWNKGIMHNIKNKKGGPVISLNLTVVFSSGFFNQIIFVISVKCCFPILA